MIKITNEIVNKPYFFEKGSVISNYPSHVLNTSRIKDVFELGDKAVEYKIIGYNEPRDVLNLISTHPTKNLGIIRTNVPRLDLINGFWWYDPYKDIFEEVDQLFDKFLYEYN